ncbi:MAG: hypothetical protein IK078_10390 [Lachnospiraceae bacterium]|nr:hypothetical protein [Lachnospiraceae bacterium]
MGKKKILTMLAMMIACIFLPVKAFAATANVTPDTFYDYFIMDNACAYPSENYDAFCMEGDFSSLKGQFRAIVLDRGVRIYSEDSQNDGSSQTAWFTGIRFVISASGATIENLGITMDESEGAEIRGTLYSAVVSIVGENENELKGVSVCGNQIQFSTSVNTDSYGIYSNLAQASISSNTIGYDGNTQLMEDPETVAVNNVIRVEGGTADLRYNHIHASLPSVYVPWSEVPSGSGNWISAPVSEAICLKDCTAIDFVSNTIEVETVRKIGNYDTIYAVDAPSGAAQEANFVSNEILINSQANYAYGIMADCPKVLYRDNLIKGKGGYYISGIDMSGSSIKDAEADGNIFELQSNTLCYGMYIQPMGQQIEKLTLSGNTLKEKAPFCFGIQARTGISPDETAVCNENTIIMEGSNLMGIALDISGKCEVKENIIKAPGTNDDEETFWDLFGKKPSYGIYLRSNAGANDQDEFFYDVQKNTIKASDTGILADNRAVISENIIEAGGDYAIKCNGESLPEDITSPVVSVIKNMLISAKYEGDESVSVTGMDVLIKENYGKNGSGQNGGGENGSENGGESSGGQGGSKSTPAETNTAAKPAADPSKDTTASPAKTTESTAAAKKHVVKMTASNMTYKHTTKTKKYTVKVKLDGKKGKSFKVTLKVNGKTYTKTTNIKGVAVFKLNQLKKVGKYKAKIKVQKKIDGKTYKASKKVKITVK